MEMNNISSYETRAAKRLLIVCTQMEPGGVQRLAIELQNELVSEGYVVDICFIYKKRQIQSQLPSSFCLLNDPTKNPFRAMLAMIRLYNIMRRGRYDAVLGFAHYSSPIATGLAWLAGIKSRVATQTNPPRRSKVFAVPLDRLFGRLGAYTANVAASQAIADCFINYSLTYKRRLRVIHNGVRIDSPTLTRYEARERLGIDSEDKLIINCGRMSDQKNQLFILELLENLPNYFKVRILGEGELRSDLERHISKYGLGDRAVLIGELPPNEVANFLLAGDVFLFPSKYEAFGLAMVEAMAVGVPVICSDYSALIEVSGGAARVISTEKRSEWLEAIVTITSNDDLVNDMVLKGKRRSADFSFSRMSEKFADVLFDQQ